MTASACSDHEDRLHRRRARPLARAVAAGLLVVLTAACGPAHGPTGHDADSRTEGHGSDSSEQHHPRLFPGRTVQAALSGTLDTQAVRARRLMKAWWTEHGSRPDDTAFTTFLEQITPPPPSPRERAREIRRLHVFVSRRTAGGVTASGWLDDHGKDDIWKEYADQVPSDRKLSGDDIDAMLDLGSQITDTLANRFRQPSPYVVDPSLRPDKAGQASNGDTCTCSYPSNHATDSAAAVALLSRLDPGRARSYRHMQEEVDFSRLYMAGHTISDIATGTLLGDLLGEYFYITRTQSGVSR
jgi:hypothetical protein